MKRQSVVWLDRGWQPVRIGFAPNEEAFNDAIRALGRLDHPGTEYPSTLGCTTCISAWGEHKPTALVTIDGSADGWETWQLAGMFAHEALHVWRFCLRVMKEDLPASEELEAHAIQHITAQLMEAYHATRARRPTARRGKR